MPLAVSYLLDFATIHSYSPFFTVFNLKRHSLLAL